MKIIIDQLLMAQKMVRIERYSLAESYIDSAIKAARGAEAKSVVQPVVSLSESPTPEGVLERRTLIEELNKRYVFLQAQIGTGHWTNYYDEYVQLKETLDFFKKRSQG